MEKGFIDNSHWVRGGKDFMLSIRSLGYVIEKKAEFVTAWKCSKCGKVELFV